MITLIIPTLNAQDSLPRLLSSIGQYDDIDIVISDGGSDDDSLEIALDFKASIALGLSGRGAQLARGANWALQKAQKLSANPSASASAPHYLLFLHADCVLPKDWYQNVQDFLARGPRKIGYFRYQSCQTGVAGWVLKFWVDLRCWAWRLPYGDQGLLILADHYRALGGYNPDYALFEDVDFVDRIRKTYGGKTVAGASKFNRQNPISSSFTLGYLWIWAIASLFAVALQWGLSAGALLNPHMLSQSSILSSLILIGVGSYQLSPIKHRLVLACLHKDGQTRAPIGKGSDIAQNIRSDMKLGVKLGMDAGVNCVKCCGPLMLIMFVFGLMNAVIMALMTLFILSERHIKYSYGLIKASGIGLIFMGLGIGLQNWL